MYKLRDYQQGAVDTTKSHFKKSKTSAVLELATGAGKSLIIAEIANWLRQVSGKKVLCLQPQKELCQQNYDKYLATGNRASIYCASISSKKDMLQDVVYGSPQTVSRSLDKFGAQFGAVIVDEAHRTDDTVKKIINKIKSENPLVRILALTATPYRMGTGYIYGVDIDNKTLDEESTVNPFYGKLIYQVLAPYLIDNGYLTPPTTQATLSHYDTSELKTKSNGEFTAKSLEQAFTGQGRKTARIVEQIVEAAHNRQGVMIFAATIQHANEVMESLPDSKAIVTGQTKKAERESIINRFKAKQFKYLVNVAVLTTGFDAPHVDLVAVLRATESASLFQQIVGRGLRLEDGKDDCLIMDFAENIERHELEDNLFAPKITTSIKSGESFNIEALCQTCGLVNEFTGRSDPDFKDFEVDANGYYIDLMGTRVETEKGQYMPAHYGRRCNGNHLVKGEFQRCEERWSVKVCEKCEHENDIAARYCSNKSCKAELVDPNEKLVTDFQKIKKDPTQLTHDKVIGWSCKEWYSQRGVHMLKVDYVTEFRSFPVWYTPNTGKTLQERQWLGLSEAVFGQGKKAPDVDLFLQALKKGHGVMPRTIGVKKEKGGKFFSVYAHNKEETTIDNQRG